MATSDNNGFEFRFDCFHPIFKHSMFPFGTSLEGMIAQ